MNTPRKTEIGEVYEKFINEVINEMDDVIKDKFLDEIDRLFNDKNLRVYHIYTIAKLINWAHGYS